MGDMKPEKPRRSLLERADKRFDFGGQLRRLAPGQADEGPVVEGRSRARPAAPDRKTARVVETPLEPSAPQPVDQPESTITQPPAANTPAPVARAGAPVQHRRFVPRLPVQTLDRGLLAQHGLVDPEAMTGALAEEFRIIKRQLLRNAVGMPGGRRILVTSSQPDEGKTFSVLNLALSLSADPDLSVILIDGDFARRDVTRKLGLRSGPGLSDALLDSAIRLEDCVIPTSMPRLSVLPAGPATVRDTELLGSARMAELLEQLEADAPERVLLFDSMPLLAASSPGVIAQLCGQALVVVRADVTRESALRDAIGLIGQHNGISMLLNRVHFTPEGRRFGSYYGEGG